MAKKLSFAKAWEQARKAGKGIFDWNGKLYNTSAQGEDLRQYATDLAKKGQGDLDMFIGSVGAPGEYLKNGLYGGWKVNTAPEASQQRIDTLQAAPTTMEPANYQTRLNMFTDDDIRNLNFNNYQGLVNAAANPANDNNAFMIALKNRYGNDVTKWNQQQIENDLGVRGKYRSFGGGDFGDMSRAMASWLGTYNGTLDGRLGQQLNDTLNNLQAPLTPPINTTLTLTVPNIPVQQNTTQQTTSKVNTKVEPKSKKAVKSSGKAAAKKVQVEQKEEPAKKETKQQQSTQQQTKSTYLNPIKGSNVYTKTFRTQYDDKGNVYNDAGQVIGRHAKWNPDNGTLHYTINLPRNYTGANFKQGVSNGTRYATDEYGRVYFPNGRVKLKDGTMKNWKTTGQGTVQIYQQGGTLDNTEEQKAFIAFLMQESGAKNQEQLEQFIQSLGEEGLKQEYQKFVQAIKQGIPTQKLGGKLSYLKYLRNGGYVDNNTSTEALPQSPINEFKSKFKKNKKEKKELTLKKKAYFRCGDKLTVKKRQVR